MARTSANYMRLDQVLVQRGLAPSRNRAQQLIGAGAVSVDGAVVWKPAARVPLQAKIAVEEAIPFVSRAGLKLAAALDTFGVNVSGLVALDVGASTGGFTDCLLQRGASRVYAVDVGHGQLDERLRRDGRVISLEGTDIRGLRALPERPNIAVVDVSFISLRLVLPAVARLLPPGASVIALVKPQFEAGPGAVGKAGVLRDPALRSAVVAGILAWLQEEGWQVLGSMQSPVPGSEGNIEYLVHATTPVARTALSPEQDACHPVCATARE